MTFSPYFFVYLSMLENITKNHKYWVNYLKTIGCSDSIAEDLVQDLYLKMYNNYSVYKSYSVKGNISEGFFAVCLKNSFLDYKKSSKSKRYVYDSEYLLSILSDTDSDTELSKKEALDKILKKLEDVINSFEYDYDKNLAREYFYTSKSMRDLAKLTDISLTSIYNSISNYKEFISYKLKEDIDDYFNGEYELIK